MGGSQPFRPQIGTVASICVRNEKEFLARPEEGASLFSLGFRDSMALQVSFPWGQSAAHNRHSGYHSEGEESKTWHRTHWRSGDSRSVVQVAVLFDVWENPLTGSTSYFLGAAGENRSRTPSRSKGIYGRRRSRGMRR